MAEGGRSGERSGDDDRGLRFVPPSSGWVPPAEAGRVILRVIIAVKKPRDAERKDAA
jgi:hypothetical protein